MSFFKPTKPSKRPGTNNWQFVRRLPKPLHDRLGGHRLIVDLPAYRQAAEKKIDVELEPKLSLSLNTNDQVVAYDRCYAIDRILMRLFEVIRTGTNFLSDKEVEEYAQSVLFFYKETHVDSVGLPSETKTLESIVVVEDLFKMGEAGIFTKDPRSIQYWQIYEYPILVGYKFSDISADAINFRVGNLVNWWMYKKDLRLSFENRQRLLLKVDEIARYAELIGVKGYNAQTFSKQEKTVPVRFVSFDTIFDAWKAEQTRYETIRKRETAINSLRKSLPHDNANAVTLAQLQHWRNEIKSLYAAITVNNVYIAGVKSVFAYAKDMRFIDTNEAVDLKRVKTDGDSDQGVPYTDREMIKFVDAARQEGNTTIKYVVLLLAATGARIGEILQLGYDQIFDARDPDVEGDVSWVQFRHSSFGSKLKTTDSKRKVPLSTSLLGPDFYEFVKVRHGKPLFYDPVERKGRKGAQHDSVRAKTGPWLSKFPKSDPEIDTHHGVRHWIYTRANDVKIRREIVNDFTGHAHSGAQGGYGLKNNVKVLSEEMEKVFELFNDKSAR